MTYNIVRYHFGKAKRILFRNVTLATAQAHCSDPSSKGDGWFDGYERA